MSAIARAPSKRLGRSELLDPPQPARATPASARAARLSGGLLALALDARLRCDRRNGRLVMAAGTIPDHIGLRDALLARLRLDLAPGELGLGEVIPTGQVEGFQRALQF